MTDVRVLLFGDGAWAARSLERIGAEDGMSPIGVVLRRRPTSPDLEAAARALDLPVLRPDGANETAFVERVRALAPDLCLSIAYDQILRRPLRAIPRLGFVNFHAGKLPHYRGRNIINWALINGEPEVGVTSHVLDDGIDTGDILIQRTIPVGWTDGYGDVLDRVIAAMPDLVVETVRALARGTVERRPQAHLPGSYFGGREEGDEWLDWSDTSRNLHNKVRAITRPGPGARTTVGGETAIVWRAFADPSWPSYLATPGQVVGRADGGVLVKTGDSTLRVDEVQVGAGPSGPPTWKIGTRLGAARGGILEGLARRLRELEERIRGGAHVAR